MKFLKNLFNFMERKSSVQPLQETITNGVIKEIDTFGSNAAKVVKPEDSLAAGMLKLRNFFGSCIEAKPGFRRFRKNTLDGSIDTIVTSETTSSFVGSLGHPRLNNSTLNISRVVGEDANASLADFYGKKNGFWNRIELDSTTKQPTPEFLGLRRDYAWGKDGLKKITSTQETTTTIPYGTSRELRPEVMSFADRNGWLPTTEYPQKCPGKVKTIVTDKKPSIQPTIYRDETQNVLKEHQKTTRLYDGPKYIDRYSEYKTPLW